jgi:hypothetical protein
MDKQRITVWVTGSIKSRLEAASAKTRVEERAWIDEQVSRGMDLRKARMEALRLRPHLWPGPDALAAAAIRRRLEQEDLAGPWEPLTEDEERRLQLSGRWPGPDVGGLVVERQFGLPSALLLELRTAAWRVSEPWLQLLEDEGLVNVQLNAAERERRDELAAQLMPVPRIVREALAAPFVLSAKTRPDGRETISFE